MPTNPYSDAYSDTHHRDAPAHPYEHPRDDRQARRWEVACHAAPLAWLLMPFFFLSLVVPFVLLLSVGRDDARIAFHAREALNFQLNVLLASLLLTVTLVGILLVPVLWAGSVALSIIAAVHAGEGREWRYPWVLRLISAEPAEPYANR